VPKDQYRVDDVLVRLANLQLIEEKVKKCLVLWVLLLCILVLYGFGSHDFNRCCMHR
jgi:hypothetical protein